jgi:hypothetical protein
LINRVIVVDDDDETSGADNIWCCTPTDSPDTTGQTLILDVDIEREEYN